MQITNCSFKNIQTHNKYWTGYVSLLRKTGPGRSMKGATALTRLIILHLSMGAALSDKSKDYLSASLQLSDSSQLSSIPSEEPERNTSLVSSAASSAEARDHNSTTQWAPSPSPPLPPKPGPVFTNCFLVIKKKNPLSLSQKHWELGIIVSKCKEWTILMLFFLKQDMRKLKTSWKGGGKKFKWQVIV